MLKIWLALFAFAHVAFLQGADKVGKAHQIAVPQGTISISLPKGWTLAQNEPCDTVVFEPSEWNKKQKSKLAGEMLFTMFKRKHFFSAEPCKGEVAIDYKTNPGKLQSWEELMEEERKESSRMTKYADGIERFVVKKIEKKTIDGLSVYVQESAYGKYMEFPVKDGGVAMSFLTDRYHTPILMGAHEYLLSVDVIFYDDKYYTPQRRDEIEHEIVNLFKSFSFHPQRSVP